ncbi:Hypothetical protein CINCED_3A025937 [Cinara cedri]|uniref:Uncharacterized protein n=1 Tax=Cinara cedri TaxID=506608 RepID=A0A5E4NG95_9HEMI|nr:Hypothetical protein CINCED_3A025937 [Cinara cedri]
MISLPIAAIAAIAAFTPGSLGVNSDSTTVTFLVQAGLSTVAVSSLCIALRSINYYELCKGNRTSVVNSNQPLQNSTLSTVGGLSSSSVDNDLPPPYSEVVINTEPTLVNDRPPSYSEVERVEI